MLRRFACRIWWRRTDSEMFSVVIQRWVDVHPWTSKLQVDFLLVQSSVGVRWLSSKLSLVQRATIRSSRPVLLYWLMLAIKKLSYWNLGYIIYSLQLITIFWTPRTYSRTSTMANPGSSARSDISTRLESFNPVLDWGFLNSIWSVTTNNPLTE